ncbi:MAG: polysaccharide biosynthesis tyrosine autokinase [Leptolyngbyaceae cyanobacterium SM2_3_12]|nr:polysaccharide biosynthesis tyrosine autokinase [Leptolyngbyaceae cyanobacterium SM2_3_12]
MNDRPFNSLPLPAAELSNSLESDQSMDLQRIFAALRRNALLIAATTLAVAVAAGLRAKLTPPTYLASFEILIQPTRGEAQVAELLARNTQPGTETALSLDDQVKILISPGVLQPVVEQVKTEGLEGCSGLLADSLTALESSPVDVDQLCYRAIRQELSIELNRPEAFSREPSSRIFKTQFMGQTPEDVQTIAELIAARFLDYGLETRQRDIQQGLSFLDEKLPDVRAQVNSLQMELETLRQQNDLITPEAKGDTLTSQIGNYESQYFDVRVKLEETQNLYATLQQQLSQRPQDSAVSPVLSDNARYQALVEELLQLDNTIAETSTLLLDTTPDIQALQEQRQNLLGLLAREGTNAQRELALQLENLAKREEALRQTLTYLNVEVDNLAGVTRQFTDLERELAIATENLTQLLARRESLQIEAAQRELPWELITPPTLATQRASLPRNLALGTIMGLFLGVGLALLRDTRKDVLYTPNDLKRITPVPILGLIPAPESDRQAYDEGELLKLYWPLEMSLAKSAQALLQNGSAPADPVHSLREAFRSLVANLQRISSETPVQSIVISSAEDQVTDPTTAVYMAWAAAEMGRRVLLVDADFRTSRLHQLLGLSNHKGFSNLLAGEGG